MIKFVCEVPQEHKKYTAVKSVVMEVQDEASREEMLEAYESFLRAIGYHFEGRLDLVEEDE